MNIFPIKIRNHSGLDASIPIFVAVTGINNSITDNKKQQFLNLQTGTWQDGQSSIKLSDLPADSDGDSLVAMPFVESGIVFLSIGKELAFNGTSPPDFSNPSNASYTTLFDKFEITFLASQGFPFIDTTNVDFFCLPMSLQETLSGGSTTEVRGFTKTRKQILAQFTAQFTGDQWPKLILKDGETTIRVVAPNKALVPPNNFDASFFQAYVDQVWEKYSWPGNIMTVDMSEIEPFNPGYGVLFTGRVIKHPNTGAPQNFVFSGQSSSGGSLPDISFEKPTGERIKTSVFGCADLFDAPNRTPRSVPAKNLGAAFNVGILGLQSGNLILTPHGWADQKKDFYSQTMLTEAGNANSEIFCYNLYSKVLHANAEGGMVYGFAYDDVTGSDSTLAANNAVNAIITIQNLDTA